jgi:DNA-binding CsgD family transcriptional regulator/GTPase SAR1 family protein/tetratricopeptide (TPR) repeat protein
MLVSMDIEPVSSALVKLAERDGELAALSLRADGVRAGRGCAVLVCGESGAGKTSFVETFVEQWVDEERVLWGACDPLTLPRPLGPLHDLADEFVPATRALLRDGDQPVDIFGAVFEELQTKPTVLVLDDLHWADQATVDLLRYTLRRVSKTPSLVIGTVRDEEVGPTSPMRALLGDVARSSHAAKVTLPPLSLDAVASLVGERPVDAAWLHQVTGGNAFYVCEMIYHHGYHGQALPSTVRDAILAHTAELDVAAWDLLNLLTCAPGAIPDHLLAGLGVTLPALRSLDAANLIRRTPRGVAFRHDLCRLAVASVIPPGAESGLHRRLLDAHDAASDSEPAVITHHAVGAGDRVRVVTAATEAGRVAARTGAHTQAAEFFATALDHGAALEPCHEAELLELMAGEYYLTDRLGDAISACQRAMLIRRSLDDVAAVSANHHSLAVYEWYNANCSVAKDHVAQAISVLDGEDSRADSSALASLGHAFAMDAYLTLQCNHVDHALTLIGRAHEIADRTHDEGLDVRVRLIESYCALLAGDDAGRSSIVEILRAGPPHIDETYSAGYSNLTYFDVEQRRLDQAADLLERSIPLMEEHDLPICRVWQTGSRARLGLLRGDWAKAEADADRVLEGPSAPLARTWPLVIRALIAMREVGSGTDDLDDAWQLACRYGEPLRMLPAAAAIAEWVWLTESLDERLDQCVHLYETAPPTGLDWTRGDLAVWLRRAGRPVEATGVAEPYRLVLDGDYEAAADRFERLGTPYDAALSLVDSGEASLTRRGLDVLDRLGADAVAAKVRRDLRANGVTVVPSKRRSATMVNPAGLTERQLEVLRLLDEGLTNTELAERLYLSVKTVDHHVSAILSKLQVTKRRDAVRRGRELGIVS